MAILVAWHYINQVVRLVYQRRLKLVKWNQWGLLLILQNRWVKHEKIEVEAIYLPFAQQILEALSFLPLVLVMDGSQIGRGCMVLMIGVLYKKRALPLTWVVYQGKKGHTTAQRHIEALEKVLPLLPAESEVVLLGDAEYDTTEMILWLQEKTNWRFVLRTSPQIYVQDGENSQPIDAYPLQ